MARIFISYRRQDSPSMTGRIYDQLEDAFGSDRVFRDIDDIGAGQDFRAKIAQEIGQSDILLVIIGPKWESIADQQGHRRLDNPNDFVRLEVEEGLKNPKKIVIPVLVENTPMPNPESLPKSLRELCYRNAINIRQDPDFHPDVQKLINQIRKITKSGAPLKKTPLLMGAGVLAIGLLAIFAVNLLSSRQTPPPTDIPVTTPPITELIPTELPTTEPPPTEPSATEPASTEPPTTEPVTTEPPATEPPGAIRIGVVKIPNTIFKDTVKRLSNLGFEAEWIDVSAGYRDFANFDIVYLPAGWSSQNKVIQSKAAEYHRFIENGGGLVVEQPDSKSTLIPKVVPYAMAFETLPSSTKVTGVNILIDHEIVQNLRESELPGPGDWITPRDDHWQVITTATTSTKHKYVTLAVAEYGQGRIVVMASGISKMKEVKFQVGDHFIKRFIEWVSNLNAP